MAYKNPIPSLDDEFVAKTWGIRFRFENEATKDEAVRGINEMLQKHGGKIPESWVHMGTPKGVRFSEKQL